MELNETFKSRMKNILGEEYLSFLDSLDNDSEKAIFINNKIDKEHFKNIIDFDIEQIDYEKNGFYIKNEKLGRHPLHHAGAFYIQEPSAMFTINSHKFNGDEKVLDLCAAPGGKTIQIANRIPKGVLVSNEINKARSQILFSNVERMGLKNVIICNDTPEKIGLAYANCFDVVVVDAPCSGEGLFRKGNDMVEAWNPSLNEMCKIRQLEILKSADLALKQNGILIYSTCTYSVEENEEVVEKIIKDYGYSLINIDYDLPRGLNGLTECVRLYPHRVRGEGQFVAVLKKNSFTKTNPSRNLNLQTSSTAGKFIKENTNFSENTRFYEYDKKIYFVPDANMIKKGVNYLSIGVRIGENKNARFEPCHYLFSAFGNCFKRKIEFKYKDQEVLKYLKGDTIQTNLNDGYGAIIIDGCALGGFKISDGKFKNHYPKGLRNFK